MYVFRELTDFSYPAIAREFGGRDHTTVIHAVEKISGLMKERRQIYDQVTELIHRIKSGSDDASPGTQPRGRRCVGDVVISGDSRPVVHRASPRPVHRLCDPGDDGSDNATGR